MVNANENLDRTGIYNGVLVTGQPSADEPPITALATFDEAGSPIRWGGPFGKVALLVDGSSVTTAEQAAATAAIAAAAPAQADPRPDADGRAEPGARGRRHDPRRLPGRPRRDAPRRRRDDQPGDRRADDPHAHRRRAARRRRAHRRLRLRPRRVARGRRRAPGRRVTIPATRSLEAVLRGALDVRGRLRVIAAEYGPTPPPDNRYASVVIHGQTLTSRT